ncbi:MULTISPECIES: sugar ABC transporter ATP-binding protein [Streptomyces]|uniref:Sugar ABC transporter ATP-binding protein n=2 Tax=Streptomyces TaxID=1883 RepID=A0A117Q9N9_STRCK|nr:sugar ABC transporter ATP-binding protein [Streptomyces corchorusii]KUN16301.1 sugar ABC transporter ATP-binding protein [Streptomyces corchorusii]
MPEPREATFTLDAVGKSYPGVVAVSDVTLSGYAGEVLAICGANGAGKSTLTKLLAGQERPTTGRVIIHGHDGEITTPSAALDAGVLLMHQEPVIIESFSVQENVWLNSISCAGRRKPWHIVRDRDRTDRARAALDTVGMRDVDLDSPAEGLAPGPRQMVALSRSQLLDHRILLLDETTASTTEEHFKDVEELVRKERDAGVTIVFVSHRMHEVFALADRIAVMRNGTLVDIVDKDATTPDEIMTLMIGEAVMALEPPQPVAADATALLEVRGVSSGSATDVSFSVHEGEIVGIYGLVGSGRSSLARSLSGHQRRHTGTVLVRGRRIHPRSPQAALREGIVYLSEDRSREGFVRDFDNAGNLTLGTLGKFSVGGVMNLRAERHRVTQLISEYGIKGGSESLTGSLSGGNQQKVCIAKALESDPDVVVLDEPTKGIDVGARLNIYQIVRRLAAQGKAIVVVTSEAEEALSLCSRVIVLRDGVIAGEFTSQTSSTDDLTRTALGGEVQ